MCNQDAYKSSDAAPLFQSESKVRHGEKTFSTDRPHATAVRDQPADDHLADSEGTVDADRKACTREQAWADQQRSHQYAESPLVHSVAH
jgi:hypothetical protein